MFIKRFSGSLLLWLSVFAMPATAEVLTYSPEKVLFLENSVVDLERNIEILNFNWTAGQHFCNVYASVYGVRRTSSQCTAFKGYTDPTFTAQSGWRIGSGQELVDVFSLLSTWSTVNTGNSIYSYKGPEYAPWVTALHSPHTHAGHPSFLVNVTRGMTATSSGSYQVDWTPTSTTTGSLRFSYSGLSGDQSNTSTLLIRDWLGSERPLFGVTAPVGVAGGFVVLALLMRRRRVR